MDQGLAKRLTALADNGYPFFGATFFKHALEVDLATTQDTRPSWVFIHKLDVEGVCVLIGYITGVPCKQNKSELRHGRLAVEESSKISPLTNIVADSIVARDLGPTVYASYHSAERSIQEKCCTL